MIDSVKFLFAEEYDEKASSEFILLETSKELMEEILSGLTMLFLKLSIFLISFIMEEWSLKAGPTTMQCCAPVGKLIFS